jgi:threonyl-tRNA synthetase
MGSLHLSQANYEEIEKQVESIAKENQPFERVILTKAEALELFACNPFKVDLIRNKVPEGSLTSAYSCGSLVDLCMGPHLPSTALVRGFKVTKNSTSNWLGNTSLDSLQRIYAVSFPSTKELEEYLAAQAELEARDHRNIGPQQNLFHFNQLSPGSAFFFPHGARIYNKLLDFMRREYLIRGYEEVISPNIYNAQLWKISGHYFKYKDNMFMVETDDTSFGLKPMNCPGHCLMFDMAQKSYRDLPLRMADFGVLHRNEIHGALTGLTRVRRFQQDDAHIFCRDDQIEDEILGVLDFLDHVYTVFGFKYALELSTRPKEFLGEIAVWDKAEAQLIRALDQFGKPYKINPEDGAFYGPKIDVKLFDAYQREHQCGTVQLDFQLPKRFNLQYRVKEAEKKELTEEEVARLKEEKEEKKKREKLEREKAKQ